MSVVRHAPFPSVENAIRQLADQTADECAVALHALRQPARRRPRPSQSAFSGTVRCGLERKRRGSERRWTPPRRDSFLERVRVFDSAVAKDGSIVPVADRVRRNLPWDAFPSVLSTEVEHYLTWLSGADLLADDGPPRTCKPTTIRQRRELIRAAASNLVEAGFACDDLTSLSVLTDPDNVKKLVVRLLEKNNRKVSAFSRGVATELIYIARHHCRRCDADLERLRDLRRRMGPLKAGLTKRIDDYCSSLKTKGPCSICWAFPFVWPKQRERQRFQLHGACR